MSDQESDDAIINFMSMMKGYDTCQEEGHLPPVFSDVNIATCGKAWICPRCIDEIGKDHNVIEFSR